MSKKLLIDTDPGIDDAMAIALAHYSSSVDLIGLTTVFGNVSVEQATLNALTLLDQLDSSIPVAQGAGCPLCKKLNGYPDFVHGKNGFGDIHVPPPRRKAVKESAADFMIGQVLADPGNITIVTIGPLTNLALALKKNAKILDAVDQIVIMGGAISVNGNVNPAAEANMLSDPHAADFVLTQPGPMTIVGLDVTHQVIMSPAFLKEVHGNNGKIGNFLYSMVEFYLEFHQSIGIEGLYTHDPSAVMYAIAPELFKVRQGEIRVVREGIAMGQTIMNLNNQLLGDTAWNHFPKHGACMKVDADELLELYRKTFA